MRICPADSTHVPMSSHPPSKSSVSRGAGVVALALLAGCAGIQEPAQPGQRPLTAAEGRAVIAKLLPDAVRDKPGWATDIFAAFASLDLPATAENFCATIAIAGQESSFQVDPVVPGLPAIARREIDKRREAAGIPKFALDAALALSSSNGKSYSERLDAVKTEQQLSELYEDFIGRVPFGKSLLAARNPVRTAGPMQVSIQFAEEYVRSKPYPYAIKDTIRHEMFTRRGGLYFGIAHLLDYDAPYPRPIFRFADFNAGRYTSRNAAFQSAVTQVSGIPLELDGDLVRYERAGEPAKDPGSTELALRVLASRLEMSNDDIHRDLTREKDRDFERTKLYARMYALADRTLGRPAARAVLPQIKLSSPKITRDLTTDWFANRVQSRFEQCMQRIPA
jgi:hypothetical protein